MIIAILENIEDIPGHIKKRKKETQFQCFILLCLNIYVVIDSRNDSENVAESIGVIKC